MQQVSPSWPWPQSSHSAFNSPSTGPAAAALAVAALARVAASNCAARSEWLAFAAALGAGVGDGVAAVSVRNGKAAACCPALPRNCGCCGELEFADSGATSDAAAPVLSMAAAAAKKAMRAMATRWGRRWDHTRVLDLIKSCQTAAVAALSACARSRLRSLLCNGHGGHGGCGGHGEGQRVGPEWPELSGLGPR